MHPPSPPFPKTIVTRRATWVRHWTANISGYRGNSPYSKLGISEDAAPASLRNSLLDNSVRTDMAYPYFQTFLHAVHRYHSTRGGQPRFEGVHNDNRRIGTFIQHLLSSTGTSVCTLSLLASLNFAAYMTSWISVATTTSRSLQRTCILGSLGRLCLVLQNDVLSKFPYILQGFRDIFYFTYVFRRAPLVK